MSKIYITLCFIFLQEYNLIYAQKNNDTVRIHGVVKNFNNQIQIEDMSEMKNLILPNGERTFTPDSTNHFSISFPLQNPSYFRFGRNILYLSPGDDITAFVDHNWPDSSIFSGKGSMANNYLRTTPFPKGGSFLRAGRSIKPTIQLTIDEILSQANERKRDLKNYTSVPTSFKQLEQARITADIINSLTDIQTYFPYVNKISNDSLGIFKKEYEKIVQPYIQYYSRKVGFNSSYLQLTVYRDILSSILPVNTGKSKEIKTILEWIYASDLIQRFLTLKEKKDISFFKKEMDSITTQRYKSVVIKTSNKIMEFRDGDAAIDFEMLDSNNKTISLSTFKNKVIYIDLWATWCGPCMEEMPFLDSLKEKYKNNDKIVFISLSIDDEKDRWKRVLEQRNESGHQYIIDRAKLDPYNVITVPRTILINRDFRVESMDADLPSSKNLVELLDKLIAQ